MRGPLGAGWSAVIVTYGLVVKFVPSCSRPGDVFNTCRIVGDREAHGRTKISGKRWAFPEPCGSELPQLGERGPQWCVAGWQAGYVGDVLPVRMPDDGVIGDDVLQFLAPRCIRTRRVLVRQVVPGPVKGRVDAFLLERRAVAFDRLGACAALLDDAGIIVDTNESWRLFTHLNDGQAATTGVGADYLATCDRAAAAGVGGAGEVGRGSADR